MEKAGNHVLSHLVEKIRRSRAFDPSEAGKIAVKVINHCGDEVLKVYETTPAGQFALICITN